ISLEVAEHLSESAAESFVANLVLHAPAVLFSAAIPFQGGDHHVNERFPSYWAQKFAHHRYRPIDLIRPEIWEDESVFCGLRQNCRWVGHADPIATNGVLRAKLAERRPLSLVHPQFYLNRVKELEAVRSHLKNGGYFRVTPAEEIGQLNVTRVTEAIEELQK